MSDKKISIGTIHLAEDDPQSNLIDRLRWFSLFFWRIGSKFSLVLMKEKKRKISRTTFLVFFSHRFRITRLTHMFTIQSKTPLKIQWIRIRRKRFFVEGEKETIFHVEEMRFLFSISGYFRRHKFFWLSINDDDDERKLNNQRRQFYYWRNEFLFAKLVTAINGTSRKEW